MKAETLQLAIECVEEERTRVEDMMNWWGLGTSRHKRYANELSMLDEALADLRQEVTWEPVPDGLAIMCEAHGEDGAFLKVHGDHIEAFDPLGEEGECVQIMVWPGDNIKLMRRTATPQTNKETEGD